jgi:hypothetical protein
MTFFQFIPFSGSGYLHLDDRTRFNVGYRMILNMDNMTGGGVVFGKAGFIQRGVKAVQARLEYSPKLFLGLILGLEDDGNVPGASLGIVDTAPHSDEKKCE